MVRFSTIEEARKYANEQAKATGREQHIYLEQMGDEYIVSEHVVISSGYCWHICSATAQEAAK